MSKRKVHIYTPDEKRKLAAMDPFDRFQLALDSLDAKEADPVVVALMQSAMQQEELAEANRREGALWAMYAMCGGYIGKAQRERFDNLLKRTIELLNKGWVPPCGKVWIEKRTEAEGAHSQEERRA